MSPRFSFVLFAISVASVASAADSSCKPNYQVSHAACQDTGQVLGSERVLEKHVLVNSGACRIPNAMELCNEYKTQFQIDRPEARGIEPSNPQLEGVAKLCEVTRQKHDVFCDFSYDKVTTKKVAAENCPVENITEANGCFESAQVSLDASAAKDCLSKTIASESDLWVKAVCLHDLDVANNAIKIELSPEDTSRLQRQLSIVKARIGQVPNADRLHQILQAQ